MNNLLTFLRNHNIKISHAARAIGCDRSYQYKICKGEKIAGKRLARDIIQYCENIHKIPRESYQPKDTESIWIESEKEESG